jgi:glycosyltransferase involved in cell wall biosynthesis
MPAAVFVVPGRLDTPTGGSMYDRRVVDGLRHRGWNVQVIELLGAFPFPSPDAVGDARLALETIPDRSLVLFDGLAFSALPDIVSREAARLQFVPVIHLPLALDAERTRAEAAALERGERHALTAARAVIVTGRHTREALIGYGVDAASIHLVEPGTDPAAVARGSDGRRIEILCVATLNPGKGHATLIDAVAGVADVEWHLTCVGSLDRHTATAVAIRSRIHERGLDSQVTLAGELHGADLAACYEASDVFALATHGETFGMAVAEAIAHGLPVVSTTTGAIPELVGDGGVLVEPGDADAFAAALRQVLRDAALRRRLAAGARAARQRLATWEHALDKITAVLIPLHV